MSLRSAQRAGAEAVEESGGQARRVPDQASTARRHHASVFRCVDLAVSLSIPGTSLRANRTRFHGVFAQGSLPPTKALPSFLD